VKGPHSRGLVAVKSERTAFEGIIMVDKSAGSTKTVEKKKEGKIFKRATCWRSLE